MGGPGIGMVLTVVHLGLLAAWAGSMAYSLIIVAPRLARTLATDDDLLEHVSTVLGSGNRRPVLAIIAGLFLTLAGIMLSRDLESTAIAVSIIEAALLIAASLIFATVSWRLWPARVFALPSERPAHRADLRRRAFAMTALVGTSFVLATVVAQL